MLALKRIVTVAVMVYLLIALLFLLFPAVRSSIAGIGSGAPGPYQERDFFMMLCWVGVVILGLHLITENLDSTLLRRSVAQQDNRINELKAKLYDAQQPAVRPAAVPVAPAVTYPTADEARLRDTPPAPTPPTTY
ncbi:hypothetical protein J4D99_16430 [Siccationidurans ginsengisoli]|nr:MULTISPECIES: hypothetical protein [unclassified Hymenobacter]MBO2032986.1 hypothetical protein [Hymenobacter sp. BT559]